MLSFVPIGAVRESWRLSPHLRTAFPIGPLIVAYVLPTGLEKPHAVSLSEKDRQRHDADVAGLSATVQQLLGLPATVAFQCESKKFLDTGRSNSSSVRFTWSQSLWPRKISRWSRHQ